MRATSLLLNIVTGTVKLIGVKLRMRDKFGSILVISKSKSCFMRMSRVPKGHRFPGLRCENFRFHILFSLK